MTEPTKQDREKARKLVAEIMEIDMRRTADRITVVARALAAQREEDARVAEAKWEDYSQAYDFAAPMQAAATEIAAAIRNPQEKEQP